MVTHSMRKQTALQKSRSARELLRKTNREKALELLKKGYLILTTCSASNVIRTASIRLSNALKSNNTNLLERLLYPADHRASKKYYPHA